MRQFGRLYAIAFIAAHINLVCQPESIFDQYTHGVIFDWWHIQLRQMVKMCREKRETFYFFQQVSKKQKNWIDINIIVSLN